MKILDAIWFTQMDSTKCIGIILGVDDITGEEKAFIGIGKGVSEEDDVTHISEWGSKFPKEIASRILSFLSSNSNLLSL